MQANAGIVFKVSSVIGLANLLIGCISTMYQIGLDGVLFGSGCSE